MPQPWPACEKKAHVEVPAERQEALKPLCCKGFKAFPVACPERPHHGWLRITSGVASTWSLFRKLVSELLPEGKTGHPRGRALLKTIFSPSVGALSLIRLFAPQIPKHN
jgi:hypothetical protein